MVGGGCIVNSQILSFEFILGLVGKGKRRGEGVRRKIAGGKLGKEMGIRD